MMSVYAFVGFLFCVPLVTGSDYWYICNNGPEYNLNFGYFWLTCSNQWAEYDYVQQYSQNVFYQIQVKSFKDSDGDGIGDLNGIIEKLSYLKKLGVDAAILSPILKTTANDVNYEVQDFMAIEPTIGTAKNFKTLLEKAAELDLKIIIDFIPNHTSMLHEWFQLSANGTEEFKDFYIWKDCPLQNGTRLFPNNWISVYNTPAWTNHEGRGECYLHQFAPLQPDLNYRNPVVYQKILDVLEYWIGEGVSGFKLGAVNHLFETQGIPDEKYVAEYADTTKYENLLHTHTKNRLESYQFVYDARKMMDLLAFNNDRKVKLLITDTSDATASQRALWSGLDEVTFGAHIPMNLELFEFNGQLNFTTKVRQLQVLIENYESRVKEWGSANWALGSQDMSRLASKFDEMSHEHMAILSMILPGNILIYYGAEIGMTDNLNIQIDGENDFRRIRTPFQWDDTRLAGFSNTSGQTWLPVNTNFDRVNLKAQENDEQSTFKMYQQLIQLRTQKEALWRRGNIILSYARADWGVVIERKFLIYPSILTFINFEDKTVVTSLWDVLYRFTYPKKTTARVLFTRKSTSLVSDEPMYDVEGTFELGPYSTVIIEVCSAVKVIVPFSLLLLSFVTQFLLN